MDRRKIRDVEEARVCLAAAAASGLSRRAWAHQEGIDARSLHGWWLVFHRQAIRASAPAAPTEPALSLVELVPMPSASSAPTAPYQLFLGTLRLEIPAAFEPDSLRRLLGVLGSC